MTANYKLQAERLVEHFSNVHRFRLKPSRALEAIAAVHGARDWNTLQARPVLDGESVQQPRASTAPRVSPFAPLNLMNPKVASQVLSHRMEVLGSDSEARTAVLKRLLVHQASRGSAVYFDLSAPSRKPCVLELLGQGGDVSHAPICFDPAEGEILSFDALAYVDQAAALLNLLPPADNAGADYFRAQAEAVLQTVLSAFSLTGKRATLKSLYNVLTNPVEAQALVDGLPAGQLSAETSAALTPADLRTRIGGLIGRLALLVNALGETLSPEGTPVFSWTDSLRQGRSVYVRAGGAPFAGTVASLLRDGLASAMAHAQPSLPLAVFVVGEGAQQFAKRALVLAAKRVGAGLLVFDSRQDLAAAGERVGFDVSATVLAEPDNGSGQLCLEELEGRDPRTARISFTVERSF